MSWQASFSWQLPLFFWSGGGNGAMGMSIQRLDVEPIPFLILLGLVVLTVGVWRRFKNR